MNGDNGGSPVHDILFALLLSLLKKPTALLSALGLSRSAHAGTCTLFSEHALHARGGATPSREAIYKARCALPGGSLRQK